MPAPLRAAACPASSGAPVIPVEPPTTSTPADHLCPSGRPARQTRGRRRSSTCSRTVRRRRRCRCRRRATRPARARPGSNSRPGLQRGEASPSRARAPRRPAPRPSCRRRPTGCRPRASGRRAAANARATSAASPSSAPRNPVPNIASIARSARADRALQRGVVDTVGQRELVDADAPRPQPPRRDRAVGAVVALAAHDHDPPAVRAAEHAQRVARDRAPGPFDEHGLRRSRRDRAPIGLAHLRGGDDGLHAGFRLARNRRGRTTGSVSRSTKSIVPEHVVADDRLGLRHLVGDGLVAVAVALEHAARRVARQPLVELHVQQREAGRLVALHLGHEDHRAAVGAAAHDGDLAFGRGAVLAAAQHRVRRRCATGCRARCHRGRRR